MTAKILTGKLGVKGDYVYRTVEDITLYVRTTGNDSNDGLTVGTALLTIQAALDRLPKQLDHTIAIDIGEGNFTGFDVENFDTSRSGSLALTGTIANVTPATGTATGTADGGSTTQLVDSGQTWTVNDLRGSFVYVNSEYRIIRSNTSDTLELIGPSSATCDGKAYAIQEPSTVINASGALGFARASVGFNTGVRETISLTNFFISSGVVGLMTWYTNMPNLERIICDGQSNTSFVVQDSWGRGVFRDCVAKDSVDLGFNVVRHAGTFYGAGYTERLFAVNNGGRGFDTQYCVGSINISYWYADDNDVGFRSWSDANLDINNAFAYSNTSHGFYIMGGRFMDIDSVTVEDNGGYGFYLDNDAISNTAGFTFFNGIGDLVISGNTGGGIIGKNKTHISLSNCSGAGNGTYGLTLEHGSTALITTDTSITGASGDATIDGGETPLTWAIDFANDGDSVSNDNNYCIIERKD